jgi:predicted CXXCH cytochrome family protein
MIMRSVVWTAIALAGAVATGCNGGGGGDGGDDGGGPFAGGFLGLANSQANVTQCGECHPSEQERWVLTAHANAYQTLADIGRAGPENSCAPCHNVGERGNTLTDPDLGFVGTPVDALHNVQCENCHGPGATHVSDVKQHPDASLAVALDTGCGECHQDTHHPFVEEWMESPHAESHESGKAFGLNVAGDPECAPCHVAQSFIALIQSDGAERLVVEDPLPITCVACHDPHGNGNTAQLRLLAGTPIVCGQCHQQGPTEIGSEPHHPQLDVLLGTAGFRFPGEDYPGAASHGNTELNPDLCARCHIATRPFQGGEVPIAAQVGHTFEPLPVVDEVTGERNFDNCAECHADAEAILGPHQAQIDALVAELEAALDAVPEEQQDDEIVQGARFNLETVINDKSRGVHNPRLELRLLETSIQKVNEL